jgi:hypothetical protein
MINWFKKKQPTFYCSLSEVLENYPLVPAKSLRPKWVTESARAYKQEVEQMGTQTPVKGTARCPGIFKLMHRGWILKSWFDITIIPEHGTSRFRVHVPEGFESYLRQRGFTKSLINWFSGDLVSRAIPLKEGSLDTTIKITTPWTVSVPKGQTLLFLPLTYADRQDFTCAPGVLEPGECYDINPIICIHTDKEVFIPAGTPLLQIMSIQQEDIELAQLLETPEHWAKDQAQMYRHSHTFITKKQDNEI